MCRAHTGHLCGQIAAASAWGRAPLPASHPPLGLTRPLHTAAAVLLSAAADLRAQLADATQRFEKTAWPALMDAVKDDLLEHHVRRL